MEVMIRIYIVVLLFSVMGCTSKKKIIVEQDPIDWSKYSEFSLPFTIVYDGLKLNNKKILALNHGFTHIGLGGVGNDYNYLIPPEKRAVNWTGIAYKFDNPWKKNKSPWGNDLDLLNTYWTRRLNIYKDYYGQGVSEELNVDILILDIEASLRGHKKILSLRANNSTPAELQGLDDSQFIYRYKNDMQNLYNKPLALAKTHLPRRTKISSYGDVPIPRNWHGIEKKSWADWNDGKASRTDMTTLDNSSFYDQLDFYSTSSYYFYKDGRNLAYCLFQIESNKTLDEKKDLIQFVWVRHTGKLFYGEPIEPNLAEATAIFPFFSGANGLWLWEKSNFKMNYTPEIVKSYEAFVLGLERLSKYKDFFVGNYNLYIPKSARDHFVDKDPIWRAVINGNEILIAAQNPYASLDEITILEIHYLDWQTTIQLHGKEIYLVPHKFK